MVAQKKDKTKKKKRERRERCGRTRARHMALEWYGVAASSPFYRVGNEPSYLGSA